MPVWLPITDCGIATCLNRAIDTTGLSPARLRPFRPLHARNGQADDQGTDRLVLGKVLAKVPVATNSLTQTKLNVNMFTTDLAVQPGG